VCRYIKDYDCGCKCEAAWLGKCGSLNGRVVNDRNKNHRFDEDDGFVGGAVVQLWSNREGEPKLVAQQTTSKDGHFAFSALDPCQHQVTIKWPGCFRSKEAIRTFNIECLDPSNNALRGAAHGEDIGEHHVSAFSARIEHHHGGGEDEERISEHADFFASEECEKSDHESSKSSGKHKTHKEKSHRHEKAAPLDKRGDSHVRSSDGFDSHGFDHNGFDKDGFDKDGFDKDGNEKSERSEASRHKARWQAARLDLVDENRSDRSDRNDERSDRNDERSDRSDEHRDEHRRGGFSGWAIAGIVIGSVILCFILICLCWVGRGAIRSRSTL
jgi:hypothetical protein